MIFRFFIFSILFLFFIFSFNKLSHANTTKNITINNIDVKNNQRIDTETILSYLAIDIGDQINYQILNKKLKKMYKLGLFADIKFRVSGNNLIVLIKENPMINNINLIGNKSIKNDQIIPELSLKSRNVYQKKMYKKQQIQYVVCIKDQAIFLLKLNQVFQIFHKIE